MKGPGHKTAHDVRRIWKCPACGKIHKVAGDITSLVCNCTDAGSFMTIAVERTVPPRPIQTLSQADIRSTEFEIDDLPVLQPHPSSLPPERTSSRRSRSEHPEDNSPEAKKPDVADQPAPEEAPLAEEKNSAPKPAIEPVEDDWGEGIL